MGGAGMGGAVTHKGRFVLGGITGLYMRNMYCHSVATLTVVDAQHCDPQKSREEVQNNVPIVKDGPAI